MTDSIDTSAVQVIACLSPLDIKTRHSAKPGDTVGDVLKQLNLLPDMVGVTYVNGEKSTSPEQVLAGGDRVTVRALPRDLAIAYGGQSQGQNIVYPGSLINSFAGTASNYGSQTNGLQSSIATTPPPLPYGTVYYPQQVGGFGGNKDQLLAPITSVTNQANQWGRIPRVYGYVKVYPVIAGQPYADYANTNLPLEHAVYEFGHGPLALSDIRIDENPISLYANNLFYQVLSGTPTDPGMSYYTGENADNPINIPIPAAGGSGSPAVLAQAPRYADTLTVILEWTSGLYQQVTTTTGGTTTTVNGVTTTSAGTTSTSNQPFNVGVTITARPTVGSIGGTTKSQTFSITENNSSAFRLPFQFSVVTGLYDVSVSYTNSVTMANGVAVSDITFVNLHASQNAPSFRQLYCTDGRPIYNARISLEATPSAQIQGSIGDLSALAVSILPSFSAYPHPITQQTNNPADIAYDMLTGTSTYIPVTADRIDMPSFAAWWLFCASHSIGFNKMYDSETTTWAALTEVMAAGRARLVLKGNQYSVIIDQPQTTVVQAFTPRNIVKDSFSALINYNQTPNCVNVSFLDPSSAGAWQQNIRQVFDDGFSVTTALTYADVNLTGCTDPSMAYKYGRFFIATNKLRPITYQWQALQEAIVCTQGDLVVVTDEVIGAGLGQGRISMTNGIVTDSSGNVTAINIDAGQQFVAGNNYVIRIRLHDGSFYTGALTNLGAGLNKTLTLTAPIPAATAVLPQADDLVMFGLQPGESKQMLITNITYDETMKGTMTAVDYSPGVYTADQGLIPPYVTIIETQHPAQISVDTPVVLRAQSDVSVAIKQSDGSFEPVIMVYLQQPANTVAYFQYQIRVTGGSTWGNTFLAAPGNTIQITDVQGGVTYDIQIRALSFDGYDSAWNTDLYGYLCIGETIPPADPLPLIEDPVTGNLRLAASQYPTDFAGFRLKMNQGHNLNYQNAVVIGQLITTNTFDITPYRGGTVTFLLKTVNAAGVESVGTATLEKGFGDVILANVLGTSPESPAFNGTKVGGSVVGGALQATLTPATFWTGNPNAKFWSGIPNNLFWNPKYPLMSYQWSFTVPSYITLPSRLTLKVGISAESYQILYQPPTSNLFWNTAPNGGLSNFWSRHSPNFYKGVPNAFITWPMAGINLVMTTYNFIIICQPSVIQSIISSLIVQIDTPTVTYALSQIAIAAAGTNLPVPAGTFKNKVAYVNLSLVGNPSNPTAATPVAMLPYGFQPLVQILDNTSTLVGGTVDAVVGGY